MAPIESPYLTWDNSVKFSDEPYLAKKLNCGVIRSWKLRDLSLIRLVTIPACDRQKNKQTSDGTRHTYIGLQRCSQRNASDRNSRDSYAVATERCSVTTCRL